MQYTGAIDFIYLGKWHPKLNWGQELQADNLCTVTVHEFFLCMLLYILRKSILDCLRQFSLTIFFFISCLQSRVQIRWQNRGGDRFRYQRGCQGSGEDGPEKNPNLTNWRWKKQTSKDGDQIVYIFFLLLDVVLYFF